MTKKQPVFLLGMQRSGTSLVRAFLSSHPNLAIPIRGESQFYRSYSDKYNQCTEPQQRENVTAELLSKSKVIQWGVDWTSLAMSYEVEGKRLSGSIFSQMMDYYAANQGKPRWGEKSTDHIKHINEILKDFPRAKCLLICRDPRDTFLSAQKVAWNQNRHLEASDYGEEWSSTYCRAIGFLARNSADFRIVQHESVVKNTRHTLKQIYEWLDEPFSEELLEPRDLDWEQNSSFGSQEWTKADYRQKTKKLEIDPSTVGRWKEHLNTHTVEKIEAAAGFGLVAFDYETTTASSVGKIKVVKQPISRRIKNRLKRFLK